MKSDEESGLYKEPKQETLEEVAERLYPYEVGYGVFDRNCEYDFERERFVLGAKWQQERSYSEEEAGELVYNIMGEYGKYYGIMINGAKLNELFEQFKKK